MNRHIGKTRWMKLSASALILAAMGMVGCSGSAVHRVGAAYGSEAGGKYAAKAEKALADRDGAKAVGAAEAAVAADPNSGALRTLLGRAYLLDGRFVAAETAFSDALTLGNRDARTVVSLALVRTATGKSAGARAVLTENRDVVPDSDYGLALALAGDTGEGVQVLANALRGADVTAETRQNLAYAYALDGRWPEAKLMASQDLGPDQVRARLSQWAIAARPGGEAARVALLTGVTPRADDAGMPVALALASTPAVQSAQADMSAPTVTDAAGAPGQPTEVAAASPQIVETAPVPASKPAVPRIQPVRERAKVQPVPAVRPVRAVAQRVSYGPVVEGGYAIQLGAYDSAAVARESYARMAKRNATIAARPAIHSAATVKGREYHRLAIGGFVDRASATAFCASLRANGGRCFVRSDSSSSTTRWAGKPHGKQIASR